VLDDRGAVVAGEYRSDVVVRHRLGVEAVKRALADLTARRDTSAKTIVASM
jgi:hypothetical protein